MKFITLLAVLLSIPSANAQSAQEGRIIQTNQEISEAYSRQDWTKAEQLYRVQLKRLRGMQDVAPEAYSKAVQYHDALLRKIASIPIPVIPDNAQPLFPASYFPSNRPASIPSFVDPPSSFNTALRPNELDANYNMPAYAYAKTDYPTQSYEGKPANYGSYKAPAYTPITGHGIGLANGGSSTYSPTPYIWQTPSVRQRQSYMIYGQQQQFRAAGY